MLIPLYLQEHKILQKHQHFDQHKYQNYQELIQQHHPIKNIEKLRKDIIQSKN